MKNLLALALALVVVAPAFADPTTLRIATTPKGADVDIGEPCVLVIALTGSRVGQNVRLPKVDGLDLITTGMSYDNSSETYKFYLAPQRAGDFTLPAFTLKTQAGEILQVPATTIHCPRVHAD